MNKKETATLAAFRQEFKDFIKYDTQWKIKTDSHLKSLNGSVKKNTTFIDRLKGSGAIIAGSGVMGFALLKMFGGI